MSTPTPPSPAGRAGAAAVVALLLVAAGWWWLPSDEDGRRSTVDGLTATTADCGPVTREPTFGENAHVDAATYDTAPPSFGDHASRWEVRAETFYDVDDRPDVSVLVHNLEHGYNILWYDQTVVDDEEALSRVQVIADRYATLDRSPDPATAFIAVPWTAADGATFPEGMHYALTHWHADPTDRTRSRADEEGLRRYCAEISAAVVEDWMTDHPLRDAPEGFPGLR